jgi:endonuclease/exonuclease/phosphatase (EEP) superfamily protein YafD
VIHRPVTVLLALLTTALSIPTAVRLAGDHGSQLLVVLDVVVPLLVLPVLALNALWLAPLYRGADVRPGTALTVLNANLLYGRADPDALVKLVRDHRVDVLATEELTPEEVARLTAAGLDKVLPYHSLAPFRAADGCGLWSRYPLTALPAFVLRFQSPGGLITMPGGRKVAVRVVHPMPPVDNGLYKTDNAALRRQVAGLDRSVPTVISGDFNASQDNSLFRQLLGEHLRDASELAGSGLQRTWSPLGLPGLLHLDHVLVNPLVDARSTEVLPLSGSDHRAVLARLVIASSSLALREGSQLLSARAFLNNA